jgi:hypothetical protein
MHRHRERLLGVVLRDDIFVEVRLDVLRGCHLRKATSLVSDELFLDDLRAQIDALITYVDGRPSDELLHFSLALVAKGATEIAVP